MKKTLILIGLLSYCTITFASNVPIVKKASLDLKELTKLVETHSHEKVEKPSSVQKFQFDEVDAMIKSAFVNEAPDNLEDLDKIRQDYQGNPQVQKVKSIIDGLEDMNLIGKLTGAELVMLPLGIKKSYSGYTYTVVFNEAKIHPEYAEITVYAGIQKDGGEELFFGADNVKFSYEGGFIGDATLALFGDFPIKKGTNKMAFVFKEYQEMANGNNSGCYVTFDCDGFVEARVDADIILSRDWVLPTDPQGSVIQDPTQRVRANIGLTITDFNDFVGEVSMPYFTLTKDTSVSFTVEKAVVDYSDVKNSPNFNYPHPYDINTGSYDYVTDQDQINLWKGLYVEKVEVVLPSVFDQNGKDPLAIGVEDLYISTDGVSGLFYANNPLPLEKGTLGSSGWAFSIDYVAIDVKYSQLIQFDFDGRINIPINKEDRSLSYAGMANPSQEHYNFTIGVDSTMEFPMMKAGYVKLKPGSKIEVDVLDGEFKPSAVLNGTMEIRTTATPENEDTNLSIAGIEFIQIDVTTVAPYISLRENTGSITFKMNPELNNSFLNIDYATLKRYEDDKILFAMGMEAEVMKEDSGGGKTGGEFGIVGKMVDNNGKPKWVYDKIVLVSMSIQVIFGDYAYIDGGITFYSNDPVYGDGFEGHLDGGFVLDKDKAGNKAGPTGKYKFRVIANARFGTKFKGIQDEEFKYWSFDVYVSSSSISVPIYKPIEANGFGGGMYHHMKMASYDVKAAADSGGTNPYSGITYEPNRNIALGVKISLGIVITKVDGFQGNVTLELAITDKFTLAAAYLYGNGEFVSDLFDASALDNMDNLTLTKDKVEENSIANGQSNNLDRITAAIMIQLNIEGNFELQGVFGVYMNAADGRITGEGQVDLLVTKDKWHIYIGGYEGVKDYQGDDLLPVSASLNFNGFEVYCSFYMCTGNDLPPPPKVRSEVAQYFPNISVSDNNRGDLEGGANSASTGSAFAMGASLEANVRKELRWRYDIEVKGIAGFDISLVSNPSATRCSNSGTSPQGVKGWRASGTIYAYLNAGLYRTKRNGKRKAKANVNIGAILVADLPRPTAFQYSSYLKIFGLNFNIDGAYGNECGNVNQI